MCHSLLSIDDDDTHFNYSDKYVAAADSNLCKMEYN